MLVVVHFTYELISLEDDLPGCHKELVPGQFSVTEKELTTTCSNHDVGLF